MEMFSKQAVVEVASMSEGRDILYSNVAIENDHTVGGGILGGGILGGGILGGVILGGGILGVGILGGGILGGGGLLT